FKFAALDVAGQRVIVGHVDARRGWVVQSSFAAVLVAGTDYTLNVVLKDTVATVSLNGNVLGSFMYNAAVADGKGGVVTQQGTTPRPGRRRSPRAAARPPSRSSSRVTRSTNRTRRSASS